MPVDLAPDPPVADLAKRTADFVREMVLPVEEQHGGVLRDEAVRRELQRCRPGRRGVRPARRRRARRPRPGHARPRVRLRGGRLLACSARWRSTAPRPTRATCTCSRRSRRPSRGSATCARSPRGDVRSCFAMTEPAPGAGSDPAALRTRATRVDGGWRIDGRKWFITGADGAAFAICMARTPASQATAGGATMFLVDAGNPGMRGRARTSRRSTRASSAATARCDFDGCVRARRRGARGGRRGLPLRAGAARPGADDALHALARASRGAPRTSPSAAPPSGSCSAARLGDLGMVQADDRRQRDRHRREPRR